MDLDGGREERWSASLTSFAILVEQMVNVKGLYFISIDDRDTRRALQHNLIYPSTQIHTAFYQSNLNESFYGV